MIWVELPFKNSNGTGYVWPIVIDTDDPELNETFREDLINYLKEKRYESKW